jgi:hypothetical protein
MSERTPTLADLCSAIAEGHISTSIDGNMYLVNARELRRYFKLLHSLSPACVSAAHDSAPHSASRRVTTASIIIG